MTYIQNMAVLEPQITAVLGNDPARWIEMLLIRDDELEEFNTWWQLRQDPDSFQ